MSRASRRLESWEPAKARRISAFRGQSIAVICFYHVGSEADGFEAAGFEDPLVKGKGVT